MHRRSPSGGSLTVDGAPELFGRLPPRSPFTSAVGQRTPPTCPASPLAGANTWITSSAAGPAAVASNSRSTTSTPSRPRASSIPCHALPPVDLGQSQVLSNIMTSVYESNVTAEQCFSTYGRMHAAPPLVGMTHAAGTSHLHSATGASVSAIGIAQLPNHARPPGLGSHVGSHLLNDINNVDFGLATCLATPMDPGPGLKRRLAQLPATTTAAARGAAYKLTSANDILQETSRYGDWVRRQSRRRKLERMQRLLAEVGANAFLGRLVDDTLLDNESLTRRRLDWAPDNSSRSRSGCLSGKGEEPMLQELGLRESGRNADELPTLYGMFRDDMALLN